MNKSFFVVHACVIFHTGIPSSSERAEQKKLEIARLPTVEGYGYDATSPQRLSWRNCNVTSHVLHCISDITTSPSTMGLAANMLENCTTDLSWMHLPNLSALIPDFTISLVRWGCLQHFVTGMKFELLLSTSIPAGLSLLGALLWTCHVRWAWTLLGGLLVEHWIALSNRPRRKCQFLEGFTCAKMWLHSRSFSATRMFPFLGKFFSRLWPESRSKKREWLLKGNKWGSAVYDV